MTTPPKQQRAGGGSKRWTIYVCPRCGVVDADQNPRAMGEDDTEAEGIPLCGLCPQDAAYEASHPVEVIPAAHADRAEAAARELVGRVEDYAARPNPDSLDRISQDWTALLEAASTLKALLPNERGSDD